MVRALAGKEFREAIRSVRFLAVLLVSCTLIPISAFVNARSYEHRVRYHQELTDLYKSQSETAGLRPDFVAEAFRPPSVLGTLFRGLEPTLPSRIQTSRDGLFTLLSENQAADPATSPLDPTDLAFLTTVVLSLLAFLFVYGTVTREKEEGTLRLLVSTGAPRGAILSGKLLGSYAAFALPVALGLILALGVLMGSPTVRMNLQGEVAALSVLVLAIFGFLFLLFLLATFVSMFAHRSGVAIVLLVFLWILLVPALPRLAPMIAQIVYPTNPYHLVQLEKRLVKTASDVQFRSVTDSVYRSVLSRNGLDPDKLDIFVAQFQTGELSKPHEEYEIAVAQLESSRQARIQAEWHLLDSIHASTSRSQQALASLMTSVSPGGAFSLLATSLAGTGAGEWDRSLEFARDFQAQVTDELYSKWVVRNFGANRSITMPVGGSCQPGIDRSRLLAVLGPAVLPERLRAAMPDAVILLSMTFLAGLGCWLKFRSYDVR